MTLLAPQRAARTVLLVSSEAPAAPDIVGDLYRVASACRAGAQMLSDIGVAGMSERDLSREALIALERADGGNARDICLTGMESYLQHLSSGRGPGRRALGRLLCSGQARQVLEDGWERPGPRAGGFDACVIDLGTTIEAHGIGWALICLESTRHVRLVWQQANKLASGYPGVDPADMLGWGWIGLRTALRHFDPSLGFRFSTYACTRITGTIRDGIRSERPVPKRLGTFARKVSAAEEHLTQRLGRAPTLDEVSAHLDVDLAQVCLASRAQPEASLDDIVSATPGHAPSFMVDSADPGDAVIDRMRASAVEAALARLDPADAQAVQLLVMEDLHPTDARRIAGSSSRQMRQRKERALRMLRQELSQWAPEGYQDAPVGAAGTVDFPGS